MKRMASKPWIIRSRVTNSEIIRVFVEEEESLLDWSQWRYNTPRNTHKKTVRKMKKVFFMGCGDFCYPQVN